MKKIIFALIAALPVVMFASCNKDDDKDKDNNPVFTNKVSASGLEEPVTHSYFSVIGDNVYVTLQTDSFSMWISGPKNKTVDVTSNVDFWNIEFNGFLPYIGNTDDHGSITGGSITINVLDDNTFEINFQFTTSDNQTIKGNYKALPTAG